MADRREPVTTFTVGFAREDLPYEIVPDDADSRRPETTAPALPRPLERV